MGNTAIHAIANAFDLFVDSVKDVIDEIPVEFDKIKRILFEDEPEVTEQLEIIDEKNDIIDLKLKFTPLSILSTGQKDAEDLLMDNEVLEKVGDFPMFCSKAEEKLFDNLIEFAEEHNLQFVHSMTFDTLTIYVIRSL